MVNFFRFVPVLNVYCLSPKVVILPSVWQCLYKLENKLQVLVNIVHRVSAFCCLRSSIAVYERQLIFYSLSHLILNCYIRLTNLNYSAICYKRFVKAAIGFRAGAGWCCGWLL